MYFNYFIDLFSSERLTILLSTNSKLNKVFDWLIDWLMAEVLLELCHRRHCVKTEKVYDEKFVVTVHCAFFNDGAKLNNMHKRIKIVQYSNPPW